MQIPHFLLSPSTFKSVPSQPKLLKQKFIKLFNEESVKAALKQCSEALLTDSVVLLNSKQCF